MAKGLTLLLLLLLLAVPVSSADGEDGHERLLVDFGNGDVRWYDVAPSGSVQGTLEGTLSSAGVAIEFEDFQDGVRVLSVGGRPPVTVGIP